MSDFYIPQTSEVFMNELYKLIYELGGTVAFKRKREIGKLAHYKYRKLIDKFSNKPNFVFIDRNLMVHEGMYGFVHEDDYERILIKHFGFREAVGKLLFKEVDGG